MKPKVTLIGAGLAGSLLAIYLARRGFIVEVFERRPDMRQTLVDRGRSINLALSTRGIHALRDVGLDDRILQIAIPMKGRMIHSPTGERTFQRYGKDDREVIYATSRAQLNMGLMTAAEAHTGVTLHFDQRCTGVEPERNVFIVRDETTRSEAEQPYDTLIGTDGSASAVRLTMQKHVRFNYSQQYLDYGYKELEIPAGPGGSFFLEKNALHIWPRGTYMLIALPNLEGSFTCTFFFPFEGVPSFATLDTRAKVAAFFKEQFADAVPLMPTLLDDFFTNPTGAMVTIKCAPWHIDGKVALLGDAAHAIVPFFGQGMNCAFEDCTCLDQCIAAELKGREPTPALDWSGIFTEYEALRKENTDAIADMAVDNFIEMRDKVAHPEFLLRKKVEHALEERFPGRFIPNYSMVTFHRFPYAVALARGKVQDRLLTELCRNIHRVEDVNWSQAQRLIDENLSPLANDAGTRHE